MELLTFFIGSYTEYLIPEFGGIGKGIYTVQLNNTTGELKLLHTKKTRNPSYLSLSQNKRYLYSCTELDEKKSPRIEAYKIEQNFSLQILNTQSIQGGYPCHINVNNSNILIACYASGNIQQFPLDQSGKIFSCRKNLWHTGSSTNKKRQEGPHPHQVSIHPNGRDIYVCDLGIDKVKAYYLKKGVLFSNEEKDCSISRGGGPRHLVFNQLGNIAYVNNELTSDISVLKYNGNKFEEVSAYSSLPKQYNREPSGSAIRIHPNGKFIYAANRKLDAITIFSINETKLNLIGYQYTNGEELREFNITPNGKWLIACHQNSHDIVVFYIRNDGKLNEKFRTKKIFSPVCITFF
ncbi:lactonase family protein [Salegentibacter maritimus]|uniref:Lactonase family protein n=1 Tax=Salegentibacter maritimus TaxID=2794347 RepID=A0ABS0TKS3_9FLAO|nr:lactonase family protein [Salegentibacter maritimus]MBI6121242.1 lactonase family protein [Salegentibacter maritimus]